MGHARRLAEPVDLAELSPRDDLASSRYCPARPGREYLVYLPEGGSVTVDLAAAPGRFSVEWVDPCSGKSRPGEAVEGWAKRAIEAPDRSDWVLHLTVG